MPFKPGQKKPEGSGRAPGQSNHSTKRLKEALLRAADEAHPQGVKGWLIELAGKDPKAFASLLSRLLPTEARVESSGGPMVVLKDYTGGKGEAAEAKQTPPPPKNADSEDTISPPSAIN